MKRIAAKVEEYQKDGQTKGKYVDIGVIMENSNGEYVMLNPTVDLAGVLIKQRLLNPGKASGSVIASVFDSEPRQAHSNTGGGQQAMDADFDDEIPF